MPDARVIAEREKFDIDDQIAVSDSDSVAYLAPARVNDA
jgi:hypothetical protein